jgi:hypothetical protein
MQIKMFASLVGILLGITWAFGGFGDFAVAVLFGGLGWIVAKVLEGELDPVDYLNARARQRRP